MSSNTTDSPDEHIQDWDDIRRILTTQRFAVLSTQNQGQPYCGLIAFSASEDLRRILFCTPRATRKYENISRDRRAAMLFHTAQNTSSDCDRAMSVTATGSVREDPAGEQETRADASDILARHPDLASFVADPQNAIMALDVSEYHLLREFQNMTRISVPPGDKTLSKLDTAVVLLAHGSRDEAWRNWFSGLADSLADSLGPRRVRHAYLQFSGPTLLEAVAAAAKDGFTRIAVLPVFISAGGHAMKDVPQQVAAVQKQFGGLEIAILPRIGQEPGFEYLLRDLVVRAAGQ